MTPYTSSAAGGGLLLFFLFYVRGYNYDSTSIGHSITVIKVIEVTVT